MNYDEWEHGRGCAGKNAYASKREAKAAAKLAKRIYAHVLKPYKCRFCTYWHIGG